MSNDRNEADRILGEDWRPLSRVLFERAWDEHPKRELLNELANERDANGEPTWETRCSVESGLLVYVLEPVDPRDPRGSVHIYAWPIKVADPNNEAAKAVVEEYGEID